MANASEIMLKDQRLYDFKDKCARKNICREYDSSVIYTADDYCYNEGMFYRCKVDKTTGEFDPTKWELTDVATELDKLSGDALMLLYIGDETLVFTDNNAIEGNNSDDDTNIENTTIINNNVNIPIGIIPPQYSASETYSPGMYRVHENQVYKCTNPIVTPEPFNIAHWVSCNLYEEFTHIMLNEATPTSPGLMSASDKRKLDSLVPVEGVEF